MDNPVRGGLHLPPPGDRRSRGGYTSLGQQSMSLPYAGDNLSAYSNTPDIVNCLAAETATHSLLGHARHYSEIPPRSPDGLNSEPAPGNNWCTNNGGCGSLGFTSGIPDTATAARRDNSFDSESAYQSATLMNKLLSSEVITGMLVSIPYMLSSALMSTYPSTHDSERHIQNESVEIGVVNYHSPRRRALLDTSILVSITMLAMSLYEIRKKNQSSSLHDSTRKTVSNVSNIRAFRNAVLIAISIGLPFYSSMLLDHGRVAVAMLLLLVSGVSPVVQLDSKSNHQRQSIFRLKQRKGAVCCLFGILFLDIAKFTSSTDLSLLIRGYLALFLSVFIIQPPFLNVPKLPSVFHPKDPTYEPSVTEAIPSGPGVPAMTSAVALAGTRTFVQMGAFLASLSLVVGYTTGVNFITFPALVTALLVGLLSAVSFLNVTPSTLQSRHQLGFLSGSSSALVVNAITSHLELSGVLTSCAFIALGYILVHLDLKSIKPEIPAHSHITHVQGDHVYHHHHHNTHHHGGEGRPSHATRLLLNICEHWPFMYGIIKEKDSRRIFYFMCLNFVFMLVQMCYGIITGSLGLLSDSIHMLFDCFALAVGLSAAVMSKWPPSVRFPYGYGKVDTLAGFANGVFLMIISIEIIYEAIERLMSGSEVHRIRELLFVSAAGLAVNMVGIVAFGHGHHHGHSHSHGGHDHGPGHLHTHHSNENMHGIFLHILADTLGSVAVVISTILVHYYKWPGFDPIASCLIAILIFASAIPLVASTSKTLLLALPADVEYTLRDALAGVSTLRGVVGYTVPKFWLDDTVHDHKEKHYHHSHHHHHDNNHSHHIHSHPLDGSGCGSDEHEHEHCAGQRILGVIHVIASHGADIEDVRRRTISYLGAMNIDILVQVEREGESRCWCGSGNKPTS
ncbi:hypothetical protein ACO22_08071 [Paracoccidioides brasiliensis]|uniref:Zinc transporter n=1 Tax=Paracoccidioides brasiliensis TaxID=121759 RepID=A0A1D2J2W4_PARBR|nr:hypothetical protein ACO22_08071 [Paracoccidioides brasiliensis]